MATDTEIAQHLGLSSRTIRDLRAKAILPAAGGDLDANRLPYLQHLRNLANGRSGSSEPSEFEIQRARSMRENADRLAIENAKARQEWVPIGPITAAVLGMIEVVKARLLRVPGKIAPANPVLKKLIAEAIHDALVDLSHERITFVPDSASGAKRHAK